MRGAGGLFPELTMYQVLRGNFKKNKNAVYTFPPSILKGDFCPLSEDELPSYSSLSSACEDVESYF